MSTETKTLAVAIIAGASIVAIGLVAAAAIDAHNSPFQNCMRAYAEQIQASGDRASSERLCIRHVYTNN